MIAPDIKGSRAMTLIEQSIELGQKLEKKKAREAGGVSAAAYQERLDELRAMRGRLLILFSFAQLLGSERVLAPKRMPEAAPAKEKLGELLAGFTEDTGSLLKGNGYKVARSAVDKLASGIDQLTRDAWRSEYETCLQTSLDGEFLQSFARLTSQWKLEKEIERLNEALAAFANDPPRESKRFKEFRSLVEARQALADKFTFPAEVRAFLKAVNSGGAALDLLTSEVRTWLGKQGVEGSFCVSSRRRGIGF